MLCPRKYLLNKRSDESTYNRLRHVRSAPKRIVNTGPPSDHHIKKLRRDLGRLSSKNSNLKFPFPDSVERFYDVSFFSVIDIWEILYDNYKDVRVVWGFALWGL